MVSARRAGGPLASVTTMHGTYQFFENGQSPFEDIQSVSNSPTNNNGLGPRFNFVECSGCHAQPALGGTQANESKGSEATQVEEDFHSELSALAIILRAHRSPAKLCQGHLVAVFAM